MTGLQNFRRCTRQNRQNGFVLVNALVLVAALAAVAVLLLQRSQMGQARLQSGLTGDQVTLNLDAFDALAMTLLTRDTNGIDHPGEDWAQTLPPVDLARGQVTGQITDLQARFNINWLNNPGNTLAPGMFRQLLRRAAVSPQTGDAIIQFIQPGGPADNAAWLRLDPPSRPPGGTILNIGQLYQIPGISKDQLDRLAPFITALPAASTLNVNTAAPMVLAAIFSDLPAAVLGRVIAGRAQTPFTSTQAFLTEIGLAEAEETTESSTSDDQTESADGEAGQDARQQEMEQRLSVSSNWFRVEATALYNGQGAHRVSILERSGVPAIIDVEWRVTERP